MEHDYLHTCRDYFGPLTKIRYGRVHHLKTIEDAAANIRSSRRLTYDDIETIRNNQVWDADVFGYWPSRADIESLLESTAWNLWNLPKKEIPAITDLFRVFRQIEPVSVILRFLAPQHYGIMSPPVEKVLGLASFRSHTEKYHRYLENLRHLRRVRLFDTAADVDMALWVLQVGVLEDRLPEEQSRDLKRAFEQDATLRGMRVGNLTRPLFSDMSRAELAEALAATDVRLACQLAGIEFERSVRRLTRAKQDDTLRDLVRDTLPEVIRDSLDGPALVTAIVWCKEAVRTRNEAVHSERVPTSGKVNRLLQAMTSSERDGAHADTRPENQGQSSGR